MTVLLIGCIAVLCAVGNVTATTEMPGGTTAGDMNEGPHLCYYCSGNVSSCNSEGFEDPAMTEMCDGNCWGVLLKTESEDSDYAVRGCDVNITSMLSSKLDDYSDADNYEKECSDDIMGGEVCFDIDDDKRVCMRCCNSEKCNDWILTGHSSATRPEIPAVLLLPITALLSITLPATPSTGL